MSDWIEFTTEEEFQAVKQAVNKLREVQSQLAFTLQIIQSYATKISRRMVEAEIRSGNQEKPPALPMQLKNAE